MLVIVWEFVVKPDSAGEFEDLYGADGVWAKLFRQSPGFVSTTLMKDLREPKRYMVADRWTSEELWDEFRSTHAAEHEALDQRCQRLTERVTAIGRFDFLH